MITLTLSAPLARFVQNSGEENRAPARSLMLDASSWPEVVGQMRQRFPTLAERVLNSSGGLAAGFVLVINDRAIPATKAATYDVEDGDEIVLITAIAGG